MADSYVPRLRPDVDIELQRDLRRMFEKIQKAQADLEVKIKEVEVIAKNYDLGFLRNAFQANGQAQLNVQALLGQLAQPQFAQATIVSADPPVGHPLRQDGSLVCVKTAGPTYTLRLFDGSTGSWVNV